ncbi:MAG: cytochrome c, partial [Chitinophagaceae bacterium]
MKSVLIIVAGMFICSAFTPGSAVRQKNPLAESIARGKEVYTNFCMSCHQDKGQGLEGSFPPLAKADYLVKFPEKAIHAVKYGQEGKIKVNGVEYDNMMPNPGLEPAQVADVMNYIRNSWGNT